MPYTTDTPTPAFSHTLPPYSITDTLILSHGLLPYASRPCYVLDGPARNSVHVGGKLKSMDASTLCAHMRACMAQYLLCWKQHNRQALVLHLAVSWAQDACNGLLACELGTASRATGITRSHGRAQSQVIVQSSLHIAHLHDPRHTAATPRSAPGIFPELALSIFYLHSCADLVLCFPDPALEAAPDPATALGESPSHIWYQDINAQSVLYKFIIPICCFNSCAVVVLCFPSSASEAATDPAEESIMPIEISKCFLM